MPELIRPHARVRESFQQAMAEFRAEGRGGPDDWTREGEYIRAHGEAGLGPAGFAAYAEALCAQEWDGMEYEDGTVPCTYFWYVDGDTYLGRLSLRHRLTPSLRKFGGHIGYSVRPSARRRGHATAMLSGGLRHARAVGLDPVLVTCAAENAASRRVIERCGGVLEDQWGGGLRFWVRTDGA